MTTAAIRFKIMPENIEVDLAKLKEEVKEKIESFESGVWGESSEEPIAFGLKALLVTFALSESEEVDNVEKEIGNIQGVSSIELIDYRRAVG